MTLIERVAGLWFAVLDVSAAAAAALTATLFVGRRLNAIDTGGRELVLYADRPTPGPPLGRIDLTDQGTAGPASYLLRRSRVTLELDPKTFIFRAVDLPGRAGDFIDAIMRSQIDRLTPWRPDQVVFGWRRMAAGADDAAFSLSVAIANKAAVLPLVERLQGLGASVVNAQVTRPAEATGGEAVIGEVFAIAEASAAAYAASLWRRLLGSATLAIVLLVIGASLYGEVATMRMASQASDLERSRLARSAQLAEAARMRDPAAAARLFVDGRRAAAPLVTLVLEAVSRVLPDDSFVTSFEVAGSRLRLVGFTADAPALIRLFGRAAGFEGVSFFAPTTRGASDPGDRFSIEATIRPDALVR